jgi:hypothetical protein
MPLPLPRNGESLGFTVHPDISSEATLGNPETVVWSNINHLCSSSAAGYYLRTAHLVKDRKKRDKMAGNVRLYIQQAFEFYQAASNAKPNTAHLIYYYSFLNLAKAVCEMKIPNFHGRDECYAHGLNWRPNSKSNVVLDRESVRIGRRGVWHVLWECLMREACNPAQGTRLPVKSLFSFCPEITSEFDSLYPRLRPFIDVENPSLRYHEAQKEVWLTFSIKRKALRDRQLSGPELISQMKTDRSTYTEVKSENKALRAYESAMTSKVRRRGVWMPLQRDILGLNLLTYFGEDRKLVYSFPLQNSLPLRLPQLMINYTILFWLGSLVRYDPHSVAFLMDSPYWILIDGFMTQSRVWLLELFRWTLYQKQTTLHSAR